MEMHRIEFCGEMLPRLGFGTMRLPVREDRTVDEEKTAEMIRYAMAHGVNYFDTAYPYHDGKSEVITGKILREFPRDSFFLADKYPGHQIADSYDPESVFEDQLCKCGVKHFDFYLLHNVCELSIPAYTDPRWGIIPYFMEQKRRGRIRHLGFSSHARPETLEQFLEEYGKDMDFCQIQLNYLDWSLQNAEKKVEILNRYHVPIWVMEPVRGGKLVEFQEGTREEFLKLRPNETDVAWAFRFLQGIKGVYVTLSGMSSLKQLKENIEIYKEEKPLSDKEQETLLQYAERLKNGVPCTACRYCCEGCPSELDIPMLMHAYNETQVGGGFTVSMQLDALSEDKLPTACVGCRACESVCPQGILISEIMTKLSEIRKTLPDWTELSRQRAAAAKKAK